MSSNSGDGYPSPGHPVSFSGKPQAFAHVEHIGPEYNRAASGEREKAPLRHYAPRMKKAFAAAHEGPREKIGTPELRAIYTPSGKVMAEIYAKHDNEARLRNKEKDLQMKRWREAKITLRRRFNSHAMKPMHLRDVKTPEVFKKDALKRHLEAKQEQGDDGYSR